MKRTVYLCQFFMHNFRRKGTQEPFRLVEQVGPGCVGMLPVFASREAADAFLQRVEPNRKRFFTLEEDDQILACELDVASTHEGIEGIEE